MKLTKLVSGALVGCMVASLLAGCGEKPADNTATPDAGNTQQPAASASGKVKMMAQVTGGKDDAEMKLFEEALSKATGLEVSIEKPPSDYPKVLMQKLQGGEKYDLVYCGMGEYVSLVEQGALMDLTDRIAASEIFQNNIDPQELTDITIDGKIYAGFNKKEVHRAVGLNKVDLEKVGIDYKTIEPTLDGYYNVFKKLREANPSPDYYPLNMVMSEAYDMQPWFASQGLKNGVSIDPADGKRYCAYATDEAAPVYEWFKKLYDEKLLDPAAFVDATKDMRGKMGAASHKTSVSVDWAAWIGLHNANAISGGVKPEDYEIVSLPGTKTPDGSYMLVKGGASLFGIPANAENPDAAFKILEFFATQEGGELLSVGIEGNDFNKEGDKYVLTEAGTAHGSDHGAPVPIFKDFKNPIGFNPGVEEALSYGEYATVDMALDENTYKKVVGKWAVQMTNGTVSVADGIKGLHDELMSLKFIDK